MRIGIELAAPAVACLRNDLGGTHALTRPALAGTRLIRRASIAAQPANWKKALERTLETSTYSKSDVAALDGNRLTAEGTALVVKRPGILASPARYLGAVNTKVREGRIVQPGGAAALFSDRGTTQFKVGDVVYLTDVEVRDDVVVLELVSRDVVPDDR